jgi:Fe2+ transport system protein B
MQQPHFFHFKSHDKNGKLKQVATCAYTYDQGTLIYGGTIFKNSGGEHWKKSIHNQRALERYNNSPVIVDIDYYKYDNNFRINNSNFRLLESFIRNVCFPMLGAYNKDTDSYNGAMPIEFSEEFNDELKNFQTQLRKLNDQLDLEEKQEEKQEGKNWIEMLKEDWVEIREEKNKVGGKKKEKMGKKMETENNEPEYYEPKTLEKEKQLYQKKKEREDWLENQREDRMEILVINTLTLLFLLITFAIFIFNWQIIIIKS